MLLVVAALPVLAAPRGDLRQVASPAALAGVVDGTWTNDTLARIIPPGPYEYNADLGVIAYTPSFDTNFIAALEPSTNGAVVIYRMTVTETNTTPRERVYRNTVSVPVYTTTVSTAGYPTSWIEEVYGNPPPWLSGSTLTDWYANRDPARQRVHVALIATADVPAYVAMLTNAVGSWSSGTNMIPLLDLYSNDIAFVHLAADTSPNLYLHAPDDVARLDIYDSTNLVALMGEWLLSATLDHVSDPLLWTWPGTASNVFFSAGNPDVDSDGDGLADIREVRLYGTRPDLYDTDGDGLSDGEEVLTYDLDPLDVDSDNDGLTDGWEVFSAVNPFDVDVQTTVPVCLRFGDTNGTSGSEIYYLTASTAGWWLSVTNPAYGVESVVSTNYHRGSVYTQALTHVATDPSWEKGTDYDYHFLIDDRSNTRGWTWTDRYVIADTNTTYDEQHPGDDEPTGGVDVGQGILGNHWENNKTWWFDATNGTGEVLVYVPLVDLDPANGSNVVADAWIGEGVAPGTIMAAGTGNLRRVRFTRGPESMPTGTVTLAIASGADRIRVWRDPAMGAGDLLLSATNATTNWVLAGASTWASIPTNVWVEGVTNSASAGDSALATRFSGPSGTLCADTNLFTVLKVNLEGYEAWRENDGDMVPEDEEEDPGFMVTKKADALGGSYNPYEAKIIAKGLPIGSSVTRWLRFSDHTKVRLWRTDWISAGIVPPSSNMLIYAGTGVDHDYQIWMEEAWDSDKSVTVELFLKDGSGNEIAGCSDTVRLLRPVVMAIGDSMTFGYQRTEGVPGTPLTPNWGSPWTNYPGDATNWSGYSPAAPGDVDYQGWRGYLSDDLGDGFLWDGETVGSHGPRHMGYSGAKCEHINLLLDGALTGHPGPYPQQAFETDPCYAIVVYFIGLNNMTSGSADPAAVYGSWTNGVQKILTYREGKGKSLIVGVKLPKMDPAKWPSYSPTKLMTLNASIESYAIPPGFTHAKYRWTATADIPHDAGDDGLHYFSPGYYEIETNILATIREGLK